MRQITFANPSAALMKFRQWWLDQQKAKGSGGGVLVGQFSKFQLKEKGELSQVYTANQRNYAGAFGEQIKNTEEQTVDLARPRIKHESSYKESLRVFAKVKTFAAEAHDCCKSSDEKFRQICMAQFNSVNPNPTPSTNHLSPTTN